MRLLLSYWRLYAAAVAVSFALSAAATPIVRALSSRFGWLDAPSTAIKTHRFPTPILGGVAIYCAYAATLLFLRFWTHFPTGTLRGLRAVLIGGSLVFACGIVDDIKKPRGLDYRLKFLIQTLAAATLMFWGIRIRFITPNYLARILTLLWVVGVTNAFNIIDIMDGLSAGQAAIAAIGFLLISLPSEGLYVNFASAALAGAALGFLPWNLSRTKKIFMGDSGSLFLGFLLAGVSLGTHYSRVNSLGVYAPILILFVPIYDTLFVMLLRLKKGRSPFLGSKDHFALRLEAMGFSRSWIVSIASATAVFFGFCAFLATEASASTAAGLYAVLAVLVVWLSRVLARVAIYD